MRGFKSSATIQPDHIVEVMAMLILHLLCSYEQWVLCTCWWLKRDVLELYSIWEVSNFIKIKFVFSLQAISNWCWQKTITYIYIYLNACAFFITWQLEVLLLFVNHWLSFSWWGWNLCHVLWNYKPPVGFVKKQSPLVLSGCLLLLLLSAYLWFCCSWGRIIFYYY